MKAAECDLFAHCFPVACWGVISPGLVFGTIRARQSFEKMRYWNKLSKQRAVSCWMQTAKVRGLSQQQQTCIEISVWGPAAIFIWKKRVCCIRASR